MLAESNNSPYAGGDTPKLRTACENCRQSKVKCNLSGKNVCTRCLRHGLQCQYGFANRSGKPKGSKNKATLRKLGQLQKEKPPMRGFRASRIVPPLPDRESRGVGDPGNMTDPMMDDDVCLIPVPPVVWESPRSFHSTTVMETPICHSQITGVDGSPFTDLVDPCPSLPMGFGYPRTPVTPTFLPSDSLGDGRASPPFAGSVSSSYTTAHCECVDMQLFNMNQMNHLLTESIPLRFDHSLQAIKATFCAGRMFLQCGKCAKDSANLLLLVSVINLTLQLFEYWISRETSRVLRAEHGVDIRYGYYEVCQEENWQIRIFLLRGLLLQSREILSMLTTSVNSVFFDIAKLVDEEGSIKPSSPLKQPHLQYWDLLDHHIGATIPSLDTESLSANPGSNCLLSIIAGYEVTVDAFLQSVSSNECICGSKYVKQESSL
ncbi:hypothetical protein N7495_008104 [Penicillium taxi]|uniref:uncharacterized protein n=1 Tax=Penicillium taxi TaxID=168475 RepID=UPI0025457DC7|nr:uncharacterized protein N7495_008104 [Penicillium taxi]KAJ5888063.1 hypothetical protein N7495_008104 [Penicillium taxi]